MAVSVITVCMLMTFDATETGIHVLIDVAFIARVPLISMTARVNREVLRIVIEVRAPV